jgi:hypothetical protein
MTIDGTDFQIPQQGAAERGNTFASHKYAGKLVLRYTLGVDILAGNLVWVQGPYPAGKYNDIKIFNSILCHYLEPGERVEVDNGYVGHADKMKCPDNTCNPEENLAMQARVRSWHETLNGQLKNWAILTQVYRHGIVAHGTVFHACTVVMQLSIWIQGPYPAGKYNNIKISSIVFYATTLSLASAWR